MNIAKSDATTSSILDQTDETLRQQEHLRALSRAANGIAQDIDNAVAPIARFTETLLERESLSDRARQYLSSIQHAADDVAHSVGRLRELHRNQERETPSADTRRSLAPQLSPRSLRVLLIDDDPSLIEALRSSLVDEGHKVSAASGGQAGIDSFRAARKGGMPFDIVITDLAMPDVDGHQVVASLRAVSPATPIILLTGWGQHVTQGHIRPPQVDRLLGKPPRIRELRLALAELTERRSADRAG
jgi:CheY-like chemotaxis protein